jgi:hypothetical protein
MLCTETTEGFTVYGRLIGTYHSGAGFFVNKGYHITNLYIRLFER